MSFLAPLFIAGALFVALPIIFHLIRRSPRDRVPFSSLIFLRESPPRVTRRSRLENVLLLVLRGVALTLLAFAFARPFVREPLQIESDTVAQRVTAIVVDTSASMRRADLWRQAAAHVARVLDAARPADHIALFTFDRRVHALVSFDQWLATPGAARRALVERSLESLAPTWHSTDAGSALAAAADAVENHATLVTTSDRVPEKSIVFITDMQAGSDLSSLRHFEWPEQIELDVATVEARDRTNASIQLVEASDVGLDGTSRASQRIRVSNSSDSDQGTLRIRWAGVQDEPVDLYVAPGKSRIVHVPVPENTRADQLVLEGDAHDFDNVAFVVPRQNKEIPVCYVGRANDQDTESPWYYFSRAFPDSARRRVRVHARDSNKELAASDLAGVPFAVVTEAIPEETANTLRSFVESGGVMLGVLTSDAVARSIGRVAGIDHWGASEAAVKEYAMFGEIDFTHPLFSPFADARYSDFTKIRVWRHRRVDTSALVDARVIAHFDDQDPAMIELPRGRGRIYVLTSGWHPADSQLALSSKFVPLLTAMLDFATGAADSARFWSVGDALPLPDTSADPIRILQPDGREVDVPARTSKFETAMPGCYVISAGGSSARYAVNLAAAESQTAVMPAESLEHFGVRLAASKSSRRLEAEANRQRQMQAFELESRQKLWRWIVVALLVLLGTETWLAGRWTARAA